MAKTALRRDPDLAPRRALIIGLDSVTSRVVQRAAKVRGCVLDEAANLRGALSLCQEQAFDLIVVDMDSLETGSFDSVSEMRGTPGNATATVVALGGPVLLSASVETSAAGFDRVLLKPADVRELEALCSCLTEPTCEVIS